MDVKLNSLIKIAVRDVLIEEKIIKKNKIENSQLDSKLKNNTAEETISIKEVSDILKLSRTTICHKIYRNQLPYIKRGKQIVFNKSEILKLSKNNKNDVEKENNIKYMNYQEK